MLKGGSLNKKEMIREGTLEHQKGKKNIVNKNIGKYNRLSSVQFSTLGLVVEAMSAMVLNVCSRSI